MFLKKALHNLFFLFLCNICVKVFSCNNPETADSTNRYF